MRRGRWGVGGTRSRIQRCARLPHGDTVWWYRRITMALEKEGAAPEDCASLASTVAPAPPPHRLEASWEHALGCLCCG